MDFGCLYLTMKNEEDVGARNKGQGSRSKEEFGMWNEEDVGRSKKEE